MKKIIAITTTAILIVCFSSITATAGAARRHTIEGIMLGTGVAILGAAIYNEIHKDESPAYAHYRDQNKRYKGRYDRHAPNHRYTPNKRHHKKYNRYNSRGHWEIDRDWVAPKYQKRWNPGHYNRRGQWIGSRYERYLVKEGYYKKNRVWIRH